MFLVKRIFGIMCAKNVKKNVSPICRESPSWTDLHEIWHTYPGRN